MLVHLLAQHVLQGAVQQMGGAVIAHNHLAARQIRLGADLRPDAQVAFDHLAVVDDQAGNGALGIGHAERPGRCVDRPLVADLAAGLRVERRLGEDEARRLGRGHLVRRFAVHQQREDLARAVHSVVARELRRRKALAQLGPCYLLVFAHEPCRLAGLLLLAQHRALVSGVVHQEAMLAGDFLGQFEREAVCVVEAERDLARHFRRATLLQRRYLAVEQLQARRQRLAELALLDTEDFNDTVATLGQFGVVPLEEVNHRVGGLRQERPLQAEQPPMPHGAAQHPPEDVAASLVARQDAIRREEDERAPVIGDHTQRLVMFRHSCRTRSPPAWRIHR